MHDLVAFLRARLDEEEQMARAASPGPWKVNDPAYPEWISDADDSQVISGGRWGGEASIFSHDPDALHIAHWNPARVLAEVQAKRAILDLHTDMLGWCQGCAHETFPCRTIDALFLPYQDHPDYRPEWRP